ncbi:MAG TPA: ABC transporter permease [Propionibacteriaceae bacterium]|nr:ABC transporter permease [Propionibacteriaceae bacterium]
MRRSQARRLSRLSVTVGTRIAVFLVSLLLASMLIFVVCAALPGDIAQVILGQNATEESLASLRRSLGLDRPLLTRYLDWLTGMASGDFGASLLTRLPVSAQIGSRLAVTAWLVSLSMCVALLIALPVGVLAAVRRRRVSGTVLSAVSQIGLAIPAFWAGILAVFVFAVKLRWLPANGYVALRSDPGQWAAHLVLPVVALALVQSSVLIRYVRSAIVEVLEEDYIRTARAVGWTRTGALWRHGVRNAAISVVTVLGLQLASLLVGAIVIESVFALPGLGQLLLDAVAQRDLMVVQGTVMVLVFAVLMINTVVDLSYLVLDPRIRVGSR